MSVPMIDAPEIPMPTEKVRIGVEDATIVCAGAASEHASLAVGFDEVPYEMVKELIASRPLRRRVVSCDSAHEADRNIAAGEVHRFDTAADMLASLKKSPC